MLDRIVTSIVAHTGSPALAVFFISMLPLVELKGGIPFGVVGNYSVFESFLFAYLGSTFVALPVYFLLRPILNRMKRFRIFRKTAERTEQMICKKGEKIAEKKGRSPRAGVPRTAALGVFCFVALPLPLTGVWMGTAIAVFLDLRFFPAFAAIAGGNLVAGGIIALITYCFADYADLILLILGVIAVVLIAVYAVRLFGKQKPKEQN